MDRPDHPATCGSEVVRRTAATRSRWRAFQRRRALAGRRQSTACGRRRTISEPGFNPNDVHSRGRFVTRRAASSRRPVGARGARPRPGCMPRRRSVGSTVTLRTDVFVVIRATRLSRPMTASSRPAARRSAARWTPSRIGGWPRMSTPWALGTPARRPAGGFHQRHRIDVRRSGSAGSRHSSSSSGNVTPHSARANIGGDQGGAVERVVGRGADGTIS